MIVHVNGSFKAPVAYYLIEALNGADKSVLLKDLLIKLHEKSIHVASVTFDGDSSNLKACELLGANFNYNDKSNFKNFFEHPATGEPVYVFPDACHMLKLARNTFALRGPLFHNDKSIKWQYIKDLNDKQYEEELHCASKIKNRHVYFGNEKMKVKPAIQVLSNSTAVVLHFLEFVLIEKDPRFQGASPTGNYCKQFNDMFDALNSKNKFCKNKNRQPVTRETLPELKQKIDGWIRYIEELQIDVPVPQTRKPLNDLDVNSEKSQFCNKVRKSVLTSPNKTGFLGFIVSLKSLYDLSDRLFKIDAADYILSYKLSQDHVEMFFALIRGKNGRNNNPTTVTFKSGFKQLVLNKIDVSVPISANCLPQDDTHLFGSNDNDITDLKELELITAPTTGKAKKKRNRKSKKKLFPEYQVLINNNTSTIEQNYSKESHWILTEYKNEVIKHTAGFVYHAIKNKISCDECRKMLKSDNETSGSKLTALKNRGGLKYASDDVNYICYLTDKIIRRHQNMLKANINLLLLTETLKKIPSSVLRNDEHTLEEEFLNEHRHQLICLIVQKYIDMIMKHECDKANDVKFRTRSLFNKLNIFKEAKGR